MCVCVRVFCVSAYLCSLIITGAPVAAPAAGRPGLSIGIMGAPPPGDPDYVTKDTAGERRNTSKRQSQRGGRPMCVLCCADRLPGRGQRPALGVPNVPGGPH